jgi:hypothetical protein
MARRRKTPRRRARGGMRSGPRRSARAAPPEPRPIPGPDAFRDLREPNHVQSQAATLLLIGAHLRGDLAAMRGRAEAAMAVRSTAITVAPEAIPAADIDALGFPRLSVGAARFRSDQLQRARGVRFAATLAPEPPPRDTRLASKTLPLAAEAFYRDGSPETAAALLEISLRHPRELVRVSAAASYFDVATDPATAIRILQHGLRSRDLLTRDVAAYALAHVDPRNAELARLVESRMKRSPRKRSHTCLVVHGTWARTSSWWQPPNGDFWEYLHDKVDPTLYGAQDRFEWSGGYSDAARALGGTDLNAWVQQRNFAGLDLFTHSHGGSVAMLANQAGTSIGRMALLSCPVHWPKYTPDFNLVGKVVSVRVHLDLVILADRGGQRFYDSRISENVLPLWFDHFATHDPATWETYGVPAML